MRKTSVYLTEDEIEGLRRLAAQTGRSQSELIREAVRGATSQLPPRRFHSTGVGHGGGGPTPGWDAGALYRKVTGQP